MPRFAMPSSLSLRRFPLLLHVRMLWQVAPALSMIALLLAVLQAATVIASIVSVGRLIGALSEAVAAGPTVEVWWWLLAAAGCFVAGALIGAVAGGVRELINARYLGGYQDLLLDTAVAPGTVQGLQSEQGAQALDQAAQALQHWLFLRGVGGIWGVISNRLAGVGSLIIVAAWQWWAAGALLIGWLVWSRAIARWRSIVFDDTEQRAVPLRRRAAYLNGLLGQRAAAKEIRVFGLADWLLGGYQDLTGAAMVLVAGRRAEGVRRAVLPLVILMIIHLAVFEVLIGALIEQRVAMAGLATLVQAILGVSAFGRQDDDETSTGRTATELARLVELRSSLGLPFPARTPELRPAPARRTGPARIDITGLGFSYPGADEPVLAGVDLSVEPGECVAIVGLNGAGKSTLLSLLCGLWAPTSGKITIDGRDPVTDPAVRSRIAVVFQNFLRLPITAAENITAGNGWDPRSRWRSPAGDAVATAVVEELPAGPDTVLSGQFTGGTDLSGGQWQRIALARAFAARDGGAGILALDEPTAALDVRAEVALFESVLRHRRRTTTLLITHRLSSVRHADRIVVLDRPAAGGGARVIENGSHAELINLGGRYAELFTLQASRFTGGSR